MTATRIEHGVTRPPAVAIEVDGVRVHAYPGESLATALLAAGGRAFRRTRSGAPRGPVCNKGVSGARGVGGGGGRACGGPGGGAPRGPVCNMGVCFECVVVVDGEPGVRACATDVRDGMRVETGSGGAG